MSFFLNVFRTYTENIFCNLVQSEPNFDWNQTFPIDFAPNEFSYHAKSIGKVWSQSKFGLDSTRLRKKKFSAYYWKFPQRKYIICSLSSVYFVVQLYTPWAGNKLEHLQAILSERLAPLGIMRDPLEPLENITPIWYRRVQGRALNWALIMPRDVNLSYSRCRIFQSRLSRCQKKRNSVSV